MKEKKSVKEKKPEKVLQRKEELQQKRDELEERAQEAERHRRELEAMLEDEKQRALNRKATKREKK